MKNIQMKICRLCLSNASDDFNYVDSNRKDMIGIVLPDLNMGIFGNGIICSQCSVNLSQAFAFKSSCLEIEDNIHNYTNNGQLQVNLEKILGLTDVDNDNEDANKNMRICRTCLDIVELETFTKLDGNDNHLVNHVLRKILPEFDHHSTMDPGICDKCKRLAINTSDFITQCMDLEVKITDYVKSEEPENLNIDNAFKHIFPKNESEFVLNSNVTIFTDETDGIVTIKNDFSENSLDIDDNICETNQEHYVKINNIGSNETNTSFTMNNSYQEYDVMMSTNTPESNESDTLNTIPVENQNIDTQGESSNLICESDETVSQTASSRKRRFGSPKDSASKIKDTSGRKTRSMSPDVEFISVKSATSKELSTPPSNKLSTPRRLNKRRSCRLTTKIVDSDDDASNDPDFRPDILISSASDDSVDEFGNQKNSIKNSNQPRSRVRKVYSRPSRSKTTKNQNQKTKSLPAEKNTVNNNYYVILPQATQPNGPTIYRLVLAPGISSVGTNNPVLLTSGTGTSITNASGSSFQSLRLSGAQTVPLTNASVGTPMVVPQTITTMPSYRIQQPGLPFPQTYGNITISQTSVQREVTASAQMGVHQGTSVTSFQQSSFITSNQQGTFITGPSNRGVIPSTPLTPNVLLHPGISQPTSSIAAFSNNNVLFAQQTSLISKVNQSFSITGTGTIPVSGLPVQQPLFRTEGNSTIASNNIVMDQSSIYQTTPVPALLNSSASSALVVDECSALSQQTPELTEVSSPSTPLIETGSDATTITVNESGTVTSAATQTPSVNEADPSSSVTDMPIELLLQQIESITGINSETSTTQQTPSITGADTVTSITGNGLGTSTVSVPITDALPVSSNDLGAPRTALGTEVTGIVDQVPTVTSGEINPTLPTSITGVGTGTNTLTTGNAGATSITGTGLNTKSNLYLQLTSPITANSAAAKKSCQKSYKVAALRVASALKGTSPKGSLVNMSAKTTSSLPPVIDITGDAIVAIPVKKMKKYYCAYCQHSTFNKDKADKHYMNCENRSKYRLYFECLKCGYKENNKRLYKKHMKKCGRNPGKTKKSKTKSSTEIQTINIDPDSSLPEQNSSAPVSKEIPGDDPKVQSEENKKSEVLSKVITKCIKNKKPDVPNFTSTERTEEKGLAVLKCDLCSFNARTYVNMEKHIQVHVSKLKKDDVYQCDHCESCFINIEDISNHLKYTHNFDYYKIYYWCVKCATVFGKPSELQEHFTGCLFREKVVRLFKSNNSIFCLLCEFETDNINEARTHLKSCRIKNVVVSDEVIEID